MPSRQDSSSSSPSTASTAKRQPVATRGSGSSGSRKPSSTGREKEKSNGKNDKRLNSATPGAYALSDKEGDRKSRKQAHHVNQGKAGTHQKNTKKHNVAQPGAHTSSSLAVDHASRKARRHQGTSPTESRVEAKLREVGLGYDENTVGAAANEVHQETESVPSAYHVQAEAITTENHQDQTRGGDEAPKGFDNDRDRSSRHSKKKKPGVYAVVLLLIVGGALAAVFLTRRSKSEVTPLPSSVPSSALSNAPSSNPSSSPTDLVQIYAPPTPEECRAIANKEPIAGQENLLIMQFTMSVDVTLDTEGAISDEEVQTLLDAIQALLLPRVLGCPDETISRRGLVARSQEEPMIRGKIHQRQLEIDNKRYVIRNAIVTGNEQVEEVCANSDFPDRCHNILVDLSLYLSERVRILDIIVLFSDEAANQNLKFLLKLLSPFNDVRMAAIRSRDPTSAPSQSPSAIRSRAPSSAPTLTLAPSFSPSAIPSKVNQF